MTSPLQKIRLAYQPQIPECLRDLTQYGLHASQKKLVIPDAVREFFPHVHLLSNWEMGKRSGAVNKPLKVGAIFSGGQAAGGHNVLSGLFDGLRSIHPQSELLGFLNGPSGLIDNQYALLGEKEIDSVRNLGGFYLIGSGRTKIEKEAQFQMVAKCALKQELNAIVIIGGDDSNTNAALLAEYFFEHNIKTQVIGAPKTIDGDLKTADIELSFGFDSATKTYAELIGNICADTLSAKKYYHFIKLMGRSASHIALECALTTHPNLALIGEEKRGLDEIVEDIVQLVIERKRVGKDYGVILLPEGLIEFIPEFQELILAINKCIASQVTPQEIPESLPLLSRALFLSLPESIQKQLLLERDPHGNVQVSQIETDFLLVQLARQKLKERNLSFSAVGHFFGYEGRSCFPTNFDANYCYALGRLGAMAIRDGASGVILAMKNLHRPAIEWQPHAVPIVQMMNMELRSGKEKPVITKALVDIHSKSYRFFAQRRLEWRIEDHYQMPGPIQFSVDSSVTNSCPLSLSL